MKSYLEGLLPQIETYNPHAAALEQLEALNTVRITGPPQIGKTTCAREVIKDERFGLVEGFSSDPKAQGRHINTAEGTEWLAEQLKQGNVAHILHNPATGKVSGSTLDEYTRSPFPVVELPYQAVDRLPSALSPFMLVGNGEEWIDRLTRSSSTTEELKATLQEALGCLNWGKRHSVWKLNWMFNVHDNPKATAQDIREVATNQKIHSSYNSHFVRPMLTDVNIKMQEITLGMGSVEPDQTEFER